jgi:hypothetical protein
MVTKTLNFVLNLVDPLIDNLVVQAGTFDNGIIDSHMLT